MEWIRSVGYLHVPVPKCPYRKWRWGGRRGSLSIENNHLWEDPARFSPLDGLQNKRRRRRKEMQGRKETKNKSLNFQLTWKTTSIVSHHRKQQPFRGKKKKRKIQQQNSPLYKDGLQWVCGRGKKEKETKNLSFAFLHMGGASSCTVGDWQVQGWRRREELAARVALWVTAFYPMLGYCTTSLHDMLANRNLPTFLFSCLVLVHLKRGKINGKKK